MNIYSKLMTPLFSRTIVLCGSRDDGVSKSIYETSPPTTTSSYYNATNSCATDCGISIFNSNFYGVLK